MIDSFSHTLLNMTKQSVIKISIGPQPLKDTGLSLRVTNVDACAKCVSHYDVCNPTLHFEKRLIRAFDVGLTIINNISYKEQTYIEYARHGSKINI